MSRLGKKPVSVPSGVEVQIASGVIAVKGPKGELKQNFSQDIEIKVDDGQVLVSTESTERQSRANHGLYRSLIQNMVEGVSAGFTKSLILEGVGYRVTAQGQKLVLNIGFCHSIEYWVHPLVKVSVDGNTNIKLESHDKQLLGQVAAEIRKLRPPEPYKGKGIRYGDEVIRRKVGKAQSK